MKLLLFILIVIANIYNRFLEQDPSEQMILAFLQKNFLDMKLPWICTFLHFLV